jgi:hypothetical protein
MDDFQKRNHRAVALFFFTLFVESGFFFFLTAAHPSDIERRVFALYSVPRLLVLSVFLVFFLGAGYYGMKWRFPAWRTRFLACAVSSPARDIAVYGGVFLMAVSRLIIMEIQFLAEYVELHYFWGYVLHLAPLSFFFFLLGFESVLLVSFLNPLGVPFLFESSENRLSKSGAGWIFLSFLVAVSFFFETRLVVISRHFSWEVFLLWVAGTLFIAIWQPSGQYSNPSRRYFLAALVFVFGVSLQIFLQSSMRLYAKDHFYFQEWSSETMMQTVSLKDLDLAPFETLSNIHTNPPGFDALRALLVHLWDAEDIHQALLHVDFLLYQIWMLLYGIFGSILFLWLSTLTEARVAWMATLIFLLHPALLLYSTLLDANFLTMFLVFGFYFLSWKIRHRETVSVFLLVILTLALFFLKSVFQLPFILVVAFSLFLLRIPKRKILLYLLLAGGVAGVYGWHQYQKFGLFSTSSFAGVNLNRSVGNPNFTNYWQQDVVLLPQDTSLPKTLTRHKKVNGSPNYNHIQYLAYNQELLAEYKEYMRETPITQILASYWENLTIYFQPSSKYHAAHAIVDHLFWKNIYDALFSAPLLPFFLVFLAAFYMKSAWTRGEILDSIAYLLPALYIFLVTVLFEKGENMRFKFYLEPLFFVFLVSEAYRLAKRGDISHLFEK